MVAKQHIFMNIFLLVNTLVWYFFSFTVLRGLIENTNLADIDILTIWTLNFCASAASALSSTNIASLLKRRIIFVFIWLFIGFLSSLSPLLINRSAISLYFISVMYGVSFGLGMPISMEYFAEATTIKNRGRFGGISFFGFALLVFLLSVISTGNLVEEALISAAWRGIGFLALFLVKPIEITNKKVPSYISILGERAFLFYIVPWTMFCLVNYITIPVTCNFFGEDFVRLSSSVENLVVAVFAVVAGFLSDIFGRKRLSIAGFVMLGLGYATLGIYPGNMLSWYFYTLVDGIAWGILYVIFFIILWGDIANDRSSSRLYALGGLPYMLAWFMQTMAGYYIAEAISVYTIFSLASFFLFLAVIPLMYAPETLPEKTRRERELKSYVEKAKKIREKFT
jgi:MFS family permease